MEGEGAPLLPSNPSLLAATTDWEVRVNLLTTAVGDPAAPAQLEGSSISPLLACASPLDRRIQVKSMEGERAGADWEKRVKLLTTAIRAPAAPAQSHGIRSLRVPEKLKKLNPDAYKPEFLFLGFLNRPDDPGHQIALDRLKVSWARQCLAWIKAEGGDEFNVQAAEDQSEEDNDDWNTFVRSLKIDVEHAHAMYDIQPPLPAEVVTNVLAVDAVFVCLFLLDWFDFGEESDSFSEFFGSGKVVRWEDCGSGSSSINLLRDLFLLENQLPLYILNNVFKVFHSPSHSVISHFLMGIYMGCLFPDAAQRLDDLDQAATKCFARDDSTGALVLNDTSPCNDHLLHCLLKLVCFTPGNAGDDSDGSSKYHEEADLAPPNLSPATVLDRHGIHFNNGSSDVMITRKPLVFIHEMQFDQATSLLILPSVKFQDSTEVYFRNLMACEQKYTDGVKPLTSYSCFLDDLIDKEEDVELLTRFKVIHSNILGSNSEACEMWNRICTHTFRCPSTFFADLIQDVNTRRDSWLHRWWAEFKKSYFSRPWYTVPVIAAFVILVLSLLQTIFSILSYK